MQLGWVTAEFLLYINLKLQLLMKASKNTFIDEFLQMILSAVGS